MKTKPNCSRLYFSGLLLFACTVSFCQSSTIRFEHVGREEGISQNMVLSIIKDRYGFMWFGTDDGLNKFDGYKTILYRNDSKNPKSLSANIITSLFEDSKGNLWIGTDGGGLNLFDRATNSFKRFVHDDNDISSVKDNSIKGICEDAKGNIWIGTYRGLDKIIGSNKFEHFAIPFKKESSPVWINCLTLDHKNNLWIGTMSGLAIMNPSSGKLQLFVHDERNKNSLPDDRIVAIVEDEKANIWIGTQNGLSLFNNQNGTFVNFFHDEKNESSIAHNVLWTLSNAGNGNIWVGTENGLDLFDSEKKQFAHYKNIPGDETSLPHNSMRCTYVDDKGILWFGCVAGGVRKYDKELSQFELYKPINSNPVTLNIKMVFAFAEATSGNIWVGTDRGGLNLFDTKKKTFSHIPYNRNDAKHSLKSNTILCLAKNKSDDDLWIGTYAGGLSHYRSSSKTFVHYQKGNNPTNLSDDKVYALLQDKKGNLWIGTNEGGVNVLNEGTNTITKFLNGPRDSSHIVNNCIRCFYEHSDGTIWIGTYGAGINIYDPATKKFSYLDKGSSNLNSNIVLSIYRDKHGNIWAGTMGGLNLFDEKKKTFTALTEQDGLVNNVVNSINEDDNGFLWLSTKKGISRFDPATKKFKNYGLSNGLQDYEFCVGSGFKSSTGQIYFGGVSGFNVFNPATMFENNTKPRVVITGFQLFNKPVEVEQNSLLKKDISITDSITLPFSNSSMLSFEFSALNFTAPEKNQYAYKLVGFDNDWIYCGTTRTATYTNLDPGTYILRVKASNNDGIWNETGASITIIITPPFWKTWWFKLLAAVLLLTSVFAFFKIRMRSINRQKALLEKQVQDRTQSLAQMTLEERKAREAANEANKELGKKNKELEEFAYVASHDLQEPLRTISSFLDLMQNQYKDTFDDKATKYMSFILQASDRMKVLIRDLLEYSRIGRKKESAKVDLNQTMSIVLADLNKAITDANAEIEVGELPVVNAYPTEMKQIFQNLIINAIKFRKKDTTPKIEIGAERKMDLWQFFVKDNGIGIDSKQSERIFMIFQRLHTRNEYEGSGIGLSYCKKIAELHKGNIWVESTLGEGSSFFFTIKDLTETHSLARTEIAEVMN